MHKNRFAAVAGAALLAGALGAGGCAQAAVKASTPAPAAVHGVVNIMIYSINSDGPDFRAVVTGAIGDYGPAVAVDPDGKVDPEKASQLEVRLNRGSFRLDIAGLHKEVVRIASHEPLYPRTCSDQFGFTVGVPVVTGSGSGSYRGITGTFVITVTADEVQATPCTGALRFLWQVVVLAGPGTVSI